MKLPKATKGVTATTTGISTTPGLSETEKDLLKRYVAGATIPIGTIKASGVTAGTPVPPAYYDNKIDGPSLKFSEVFELEAGLPDFNVPDFRGVEWGGAGMIPDVQPRMEEHGSIHALVLAMVLGLKPSLVGPPGTGKSTMVEYVAAKLRWPFYRVNGRRDMESDSILGKPWVDGKELVWHHSEFAKAIQHGWLVLFDEPSKVPAGISMALQRYMERGGILQIDDMPGESLRERQVHPHKWHRIAFADNVLGVGDQLDKFSATMIQDTSFLDRKDIIIHVNYMAEKPETELLITFGLAALEAKNMVLVAGKIRNAYVAGELSQTCSLRNLSSYATLRVAGIPQKVAMMFAIANRYPSMEQETVGAISKTVWGF